MEAIPYSIKYLKKYYEGLYHGNQLTALVNEWVNNKQGCAHRLMIWASLYTLQTHIGSNQKSLSYISWGLANNKRKKITRS